MTNPSASLGLSLVMLATGVGIPIMAALNSGLGVRIGSPWVAAFILFLVAADLAFANDNSSLQATTDRNGTGERLTIGTEEIQDAADIGFDRIVSAEEARLGGGLDQAEEAQLGITDEELEVLAKNT